MGIEMDRKSTFKHDYSGSCGPGQIGYFNQRTFSIGIFQWIPKVSGSGLKKSKVKFRVSGPIDQADEIYKRANEICDMFDEGKIITSKTMKIGA